MCRICQKVFCCENCRRKHECDDHKIHPECDICTSGSTYLRNPSDSLLVHIKDRHWPLHCVLCNRIFETINDLFAHSKCTKSQLTKDDNETNKTPQLLQKQIAATEKSAGRFRVSTSTPLAPREEENEFLQKMSEVITPVDVLEKNDDAQYKSPFTPHNERCAEQYTKRKVRFSETVEQITDNENISPEKNNSIQIESFSQHTSYFTAEMKASTLSSIDEADEKAQNDFNEDAALQLSKRDESMAENNETLWESAVNEFDSENVSIVEILSTEDNADQCVTYERRDSETSENVTSKQGGSIWSSMTNLVRNIVHGLTVTQESDGI